MWRNGYVKVVWCAGVLGLCGLGSLGCEQRAPEQAPQKIATPTSSPGVWSVKLTGGVEKTLEGTGGFVLMLPTGNGAISLVKQPDNSATRVGSLNPRSPELFTEPAKVSCAAMLSPEQIGAPGEQPCARVGELPCEVETTSVTETTVSGRFAAEYVCPEDQSQIWATGTFTDLPLVRMGAQPSSGS